MTPSTPTLCHFTLYSRSYCHLCQDMLDALHGLQTSALLFAVDVIDIDANADANAHGAALLARFDELVPVLFGDPAKPELCHYFLDETAVRRYLAELGVSI